MVTCIVMLVLIAFAIQRLQTLIFHKNPVISLAKMQDNWDPSHKVDMTQLGFKVAFGVNHFRTLKALDDPNYVQWQVKLTTGLNQVQGNSTYLKFHKCTPDDYKSFYPPRKSDKEIFAQARDKMGFYCIDDNQPDIVLWG